MKKKLPMIIGLILTVLFALWYGYRDVSHQSYDNNVNTAQYSEMQILTDGESISQGFTAEEDRIDGFLIKANAQGDHAETLIRLTVQEKETGETVAESDVSGKDVKARKLHRFPIDPIKNCRGKQYSVTITAKNSDAANGISFYNQPADGSSESLVINGEASNSILVMKTVTKRFDVESFIVMLISVWFIWGFLWFLSRLFK